MPVSLVVELVDDYLAGFGATDTEVIAWLRDRGYEAFRVDVHRQLVAMGESINRACRTDNYMFLASTIASSRV